MRKNWTKAKMDVRGGGEDAGQRRQEERGAELV